MWRSRRGLRWLAVALSLLAAAAPWQETPSSPVREARGWVKSKGWRPGQWADGQFVAIGSAPIPKDDEDPASARQLAFDLACLDASNQLAHLLGAEMSSERSRATETGRTASGIDCRLPAGVTPEALGKDRYRDACWVVARAEICGLLAEKAFFSPEEVAVVLRCDLPSLAMVAATAERRPVPAPPDTVDLRSLRDMPDDRLADAFGVRMARDPRGAACLVSFGQSQAREEPLSLPRAAQRARQAALGALRRHLHSRVLGRSGLQDITLETVQVAREMLESTHRFLHRLESESKEVALVAPVLREWVIERDGLRTVGCAVVLGNDHDDGEARLPVIGGGALVERKDGHLVASAIGFGCDASPLQHPAVRRCRAVRAAVVAAKTEIARAFVQQVASTIRSRTSSEHGMHAESEVRTQILRQALAGAHVEWVQMLSEGELMEARVRITIEGSASPPAGGGLLVFESAERGADAIVRMALEGLCPPGTLRAFVRSASGLRPVVFAVGLGGGEDGVKLARAAAEAELSRLRRSHVEGAVVTRSSLDYPDALTADGCSDAFREESMSRWTSESSAPIKPSAASTCERRGDLTACVAYPAE